MFAKFALIVVASLAISAGAELRAQTFSELRPTEQSVLKPLAGEWESMSATRKKKWREVARGYPALSAAEQQRLTARMEGWSRMSPNDRRAARDQFREINKPQAGAVAKQENREDLKRKWDAYRDLPAEKRKELDAASKNSRTTPQAEAVKRAGVPPLPSNGAPAPAPARTVEAIRPPPGSAAAQR